MTIGLYLEQRLLRPQGEWQRRALYLNWARVCRSAQLAASTCNAIARGLR